MQSKRHPQAHLNGNGQNIRVLLIGSASFLCLSIFGPANAEESSSAADYFMFSARDLAAAKSPNPSPVKANSTPLPVSVDKTDSSVSVKTGLSVWRDYNAKKLELRAEKANAHSPEPLKLPVPPQRKPPLDVWTKVNIENAKDDTTHTTRATLGADYTLSNDAIAGISAEQAETQALSGAAPVPTDRTISAYINFKATPLLSVDAKTQWQKTNSDLAAGIARDEHNSFSIAPKVEKKFAVGEGVDMTPYATIQHKLELDTISKAGTIANSAGAGVTFHKPDAYSVTISTDVEQSASSDTPNLNSKLQLKVPLP